MDDMNITSAQYLTTQQDTILAVIDGVTWSVPTDSDNLHYAEILRQVAAGDLTIADAD